MVRERVFGTDPDFCAWLRSQRKELPSYSQTVGFVATDVDLVIHRYLTSIDGIGSREIQAMMMLEVKSRSGKPHQSQTDTLYKWHLLSNTKQVVNNSLIWGFGVGVLSMSGTDPSNSDHLEWGRFKKGSDGKLHYRKITINQLYGLLRFELHPDSLSRQPFRRHHKTRLISVEEQTVLGFSIKKVIKKSS